VATLSALQVFQSVTFTAGRCSEFAQLFSRQNADGHKSVAGALQLCGLWNLALAIILCWTFIAILQYYLARSQRDNGIIFAARIYDLPLSSAFGYRYLPTVVAVIFSIYVVWIANDARRYQPYRQMLRSQGATAGASVLLHYPFDFIVTVPLKALKNR
jgi:hypothetical protein